MYALVKSCPPACTVGHEPVFGAVDGGDQLGFDAGFLPYFAAGGNFGCFAGVDHALGKLPAVLGVCQYHGNPNAAVRLAKRHAAGRGLFECFRPFVHGFHAPPFTAFSPASSTCTLIPSLNPVRVLTLHPCRTTL